MQEQIKHFPLSAPLAWRAVLRKLLLRPRRDDGTPYWTRREYLGYLWNAHWKKILRGPRRCRRGIHHIGPGSDTGMGGCNVGTMDVWCLDCDRAVLVPIDDVLGKPEAEMVLDLWREGRKGGIPGPPPA